MSLTSTQKQVLWLAYVLFLLMATLGLLTSVRHIAAVSGLTVDVVLSPLILIYLWARFCIWIWKPLYRQEVSPGWSLALLFAFFSVVFLIQISYFLFRYLTAA